MIGLALLLVPGIEYLEVPPLHVVRIDPALASISVKAASLDGGPNRTAGEWLRDSGGAVAINAGMFATDYSTHTGHLRIGDHTNSEAWISSYQSVLLVDDGRARIVDREHPELDGLIASSDIVVQNLRLIRKPKKNVWATSEKRWSEAAIAMDDRGRILFVFSRRPYAMRDFNRLLIESELGVVAAQHAEGGPEASLSIRAPKLTLDLAGSFETGFNENEKNDRQWPIPNVVLGTSR